MKIVITLFLLLFNTIVFSQKLAVTPNGLRDESDNEKTHLILNIDNKTSAELYTNALKYVNKNYRNPEKVIVGKVENESLKITTFAPAFIIVPNSFVKIPIDAEYSIQFDFKNGKVRIEIQNLDMYYSADGKKTRVLYTGGALEGYSIYNKKGELKRENTKNDIEKYFNIEILKINEFLSGKSESQNW
jgi:hypothetical protein